MLDLEDSLALGVDDRVLILVFFTFFPDADYGEPFAEFLSAVVFRLDYVCAVGGYVAVFIVLVADSQDAIGEAGGTVGYFLVLDGVEGELDLSVLVGDGDSLAFLDDGDEAFAEVADGLEILEDGSGLLLVELIEGVVAFLAFLNGEETADDR